MSLTPNIQPALTPEEWASVHVRDGAAEIVLQFEDGYREMYPPTYHRIAALALYGQPFGLTHEDVTDEREAYTDAVRLARQAQDAGDEVTRLRYVERARRHRHRADRIAALLPPETTSAV